MTWNLVPSGQLSTRTEDKIESFQLLPDGWRYGRGGPIAADVLGIARELCGFLLGLGFFKTDAFPGADGEVMVAAYHDSHYVAVTVNPDGSFHLNHENGDEDLEDSDYYSVSDVKTGLRNSARIIWSTYALSTSGNSTTRLADLAIWRSRKPLAA